MGLVKALDTYRSVLLLVYFTAGPRPMSGDLPTGALMELKDSAFRK